MCTLTRMLRAPFPRRLPPAVGLLLIVPSAAAQIPPGYELIQVSPPGVPCRDPDMNESGQIVFSAELGEPYVSREIMLYDPADGSLRRITDDNINDGLPRIGDDGTIAWTSYRGPPDRFGNPTGEIMVRPPDGVIVQVTDNDVQDSPEDIDPSGRVLFKRYVDRLCDRLATDLFLYDGVQVLQLTITGTTTGVANQDASINASGDICWTEYDFCEDPWVSQTMLLPSGGSPFAISGPDMLEPQRPSLNHPAQIMWDYYDPANGGVHHIVLYDQGLIVHLADGYADRLNDLGQFTFSRWDVLGAAWQPWLFRDGREWRLIQSALWNVPTALNNRGEVVIDGIDERVVLSLRRFPAGDLNCDGAVDAADIEPFVEALVNPNGYSARYPGCDARLADLNGDGVVDAFDIAPFIQLMIP